jgi:hypothetical protein
LVFPLVMLAGCGACGSPPLVTSECFGPVIAPPRGLAKIHPGMTVAEAKKLVPELHEPSRKGIRDELVVDSGCNAVTFEVRIDGGAVASIVAIVTSQSVRDVLEQLWGKPEITKDSLGQPEVTWASESSGWKVKLDCIERNCFVEYFPYQVLTADFFGPHVIPPGDLSKLKIGMKLSEAKALAPGPVSVHSGVPTGVDGVKEYVGIDDRSATVKSIYLNLPPHAEELIAEVWHEGLEASDAQGKPVLVWPDPETGWRATLVPAFGSNHDLRFENYLPLDQLLREAEPLRGETVEEVKKLYGPDVTVVVPNKELELRLWPTEWADHYGTQITLTIGGGKVKELSFDVPWKGYAPAHDTERDTFTTKWGDPKEIGDDDKRVLLFRDDDPRVEIREDKKDGAWHVVMK